MSIRLQHIYRRFGAQDAVQDLSFEVEKGEVCGFLGPNGAGKSTTMKMVCGVLAPTSGMIEVEGVDVQKQPLEVKAHIGYLPEHNPLYPQMYVREFLRFCASLHGVSKIDARVDEMIELTGLGREQHKRIHMLSKGYRQRVGLAQALIHDPSVLILDEPISGLDPNQLVEIRQLIKSISVDKTVLFSSHIMQEVEAVCDRVIIINQGVKRSDISIDEVRRAGANVRVRAAFEGDVDMTKIGGLDEVVDVVPETGHMIITVTDARAGRVAISSLALREGWLLIEMTPLERSMEHIFHEMTKK